MEEETILFESLINWTVAEAKLSVIGAKKSFFYLSYFDMDLYHLH